MCGEQRLMAACDREMAGSPPRVRGTVARSALDYAVCRITPACAGNSLLRDQAPHTSADHPRVCGEQAAHGHAVLGVCGSPPRVRGTAACQRRQTQSYGITPACAGNRKKEKPRVLLFGDHPRVCGEQISIPRYLALLQGSPPRVRGTGDLLVEKQVLLRITPACAGNRHILPLSCVYHQDHPRVCGEQSQASSQFPVNIGSPPRVRGTEFTRNFNTQEQRITPACAGNRGFICDGWNGI